jgi:hypothetical protein
VLRYDATTAECLVFTYREGLLAVVGHDLCLRVGRFTVEIGDDDTIRADFDAASLRPSGDLSPADARKIERNAAEDVLDARRFPAVAFRSTQVKRDGDRARIAGTLALHGVTRPIAFDAVAGGVAWRAEVRLDQRDFGIRPFVALLGALRVRADLLVRISVPRA